MIRRHLSAQEEPELPELKFLHLRTAPAWFQTSDGSIFMHPTFFLPVRERLMKVPGVRQVVVEQTWEPGWSSNLLTD